MDDTKRKLENPFSPLVENEFETAISELERIQRSYENNETLHKGYGNLIRALLDAKTTISATLDAPPFLMFDTKQNIQSFQHQLCPDLPFKEIKDLSPKDKEETLKFIITNFRNNYKKAVLGQTQEDDFDLYPTLEQVIQQMEETDIHDDLPDEDEDTEIKQGTKQSKQNSNSKAKRRLSGNFEQAELATDATEQEPPNKRKKVTPVENKSPAIKSTRLIQKGKNAATPPLLPIRTRKSPARNITK